MVAVHAQVFTVFNKPIDIGTAFVVGHTNLDRAIRKTQLRIIIYHHSFNGLPAGDSILFISELIAEKKLAHLDISLSGIFFTFLRVFRKTGADDEKGNGQSYKEKGEYFFFSSYAPLLLHQNIIFKDFNSIFLIQYQFFETPSLVLNKGFHHGKKMLTMAYKKLTDGKGVDRILPIILRVRNRWLMFISPELRSLLLARISGLWE
jgi:hypothetical protein